VLAVAGTIGILSSVISNVVKLESYGRSKFLMSKYLIKEVCLSSEYAQSPFQLP